MGFAGPLLGMGFLIALGVGIELWQGWMPPGRTADGTDMLASSLGATHRLENPGSIPLELIEVQSGSYLGEDDIVRFEDKYARV